MPCYAFWYLAERKQCMPHLRHIRLEMLLYADLPMVSFAQLLIFIFVSDIFLGHNLVTLLVLEDSCADWEHLTVSQPHSASPKRYTPMVPPSSLGSKGQWQVLLVQVLRSKELPGPVSHIQTPNSIEVLPGTVEIR